MKRIYLSILFLALNANFIARSANNKGSTTKPMRLEKSRKVETSSSASSFGFGSVIGGIASFCYNHPVVTLGLIGAGLGVRYYYSITRKIDNILDLLCMNKASFWGAVDAMVAPDANLTADTVIENLTNTYLGTHLYQLFMSGNDGIDKIVAQGTDKATDDTEEGILQKIYLCNKRMGNAGTATENISFLPKAKHYQDNETQGYIGRVWQYTTNFISTGNFKRKRIGCAIEILEKLAEEDGQIHSYVCALQSLSNAYKNKKANPGPTKTDRKKPTVTKKPVTPKGKKGKDVRFASTAKSKSTKDSSKEAEAKEQEEKGESWGMIALKLTGCAAALGVFAGLIYATN